MLVRLLANLFINPINIPLRRFEGGIGRLLGKLLVNRMNIPLRRFAFAARRCPPSKGKWEAVIDKPSILAKSIRNGRTSI